MTVKCAFVYHFNKYITAYLLLITIDRNVKEFDEYRYTPEEALYDLKTLQPTVCTVHLALEPASALTVANNKHS